MKAGAGERRKAAAGLRLTARRGVLPRPQQRRQHAVRAVAVRAAAAAAGCQEARQQLARLRGGAPCSVQRRVLQAIGVNLSSVTSANSCFVYSSATPPPLLDARRPSSTRLRGT